jgi:predicted cupin superfamily sugar epimerase
MPRPSKQVHAAKKTIKKRGVTSTSKRNPHRAEQLACVPAPAHAASDAQASNRVCGALCGADVISLMQLQPHPEGGFYRRTCVPSILRNRSCLMSHSPCSYCSDVLVSTPRGSRMSCSAIIYALLPGQIGKFHRIESDEMWHHYTGSSLEVVELDVSVAGHARKTVLGKHVAAPHFNQLQHVVKAGPWFGARVVVDASDDAASADAAVVGCTVSPSFDFADFVMGSRKQLLRLWAPCSLCQRAQLTRAQVPAGQCPHTRNDLTLALQP